MVLFEVTSLTAIRSKAFRLNVQHIALASGKILCVTGPNGSGKTTLLECMTGLITPQAGRLLLEGVAMDTNLRAIRARVGIIPDDEAWFVSGLCAREYFQLLQSVYKDAHVTTNMVQRTQELAQSLQFTSLDVPLEQLSHGNKKKVQLIAGLMHRPKLIVIDELRNGLDPLAIIVAEHLIRAEVKRGACIIAATHDLWWAERIADDIMLLVNGAPVVQQSTTAIKRHYGSVEQLFLETLQPKESFDDI